MPKKRDIPKRVPFLRYDIKLSIESQGENTYLRTRSTQVSRHDLSADHTFNTDHQMRNDKIARDIFDLTLGWFI